MLKVFDNLKTSRKVYDGQFDLDSLSGLLILAPYVWCIDDVGAVFVIPDSYGSAEVHIAFWDGRLRGREVICKRLADAFLMRYHTLYARIPKEGKTVIAFAKRLGFMLTEDQGSHQVFVYRSFHNETH